jgi:curved DNA-binding protein CbpA
MALDLRQRVEVEVIAGMLEDLDYYRILKLKAGAPVGDVERAFADQSKAFHPDRFFGVRDPKFMRMVTAIFKRVQESYQVLRDPELKKMYDQKMGFRKAKDGTLARRPGHVGKAALEKEKAAREGDEIVEDKRARKYYDLAQIALMNQDWNGVVMNLQFATTYEKDNPVIEEQLAKARIELEKKKKQEINPYKIKIV